MIEENKKVEEEKNKKFTKETVDTFFGKIDAGINAYHDALKVEEEKEKEDELSKILLKYIPFEQLDNFLQDLKDNNFRMITSHDKNVYDILSAKNNLIECKEKTDPETKKVINAWLTEMVERKKEVECKEKESQDELWDKLLSKAGEFRGRQYIKIEDVIEFKQQFSISKINQNK